MVSATAAGPPQLHKLKLCASKYHRRAFIPRTRMPSEATWPTFVVLFFFKQTLPCYGRPLGLSSLERGKSLHSPFCSHHVLGKSLNQSLNLQTAYLGLLSRVPCMWTCGPPLLRKVRSSRSCHWLKSDPVFEEAQSSNSKPPLDADFRPLGGVTDLAGGLSPKDRAKCTKCVTKRRPLLWRKGAIRLG